jgi:lectin, mannose-binding 2
VDIQYKNLDEWTECFELPNAKIPGVSYLGFSAETGELADNHDIVNVWTKNLYRHNTGSNQAAAQGGSRGYVGKGRKDKESGSWTWFFLKFIIFGLVVTGGYVGFTAYRASKRGSRF